MRLRLRCAELDKELEESEIDLVDLEYYNKDSQPMIELGRSNEKPRESFA